MNRKPLFLCALGALAACSSTTATCPAGCNLDPDGVSCDPDAGNISFVAGVQCNTDQDCCTGTCTSDATGVTPGTCTSVQSSTGSIGSTGTTGVSATSSGTSGKSTGTGTGGTTSGSSGVKYVDAGGICLDYTFTDGGNYCDVPSTGDYRTGCADAGASATCSDPNYYCHYSDFGSKCYPKCTACTCFCFAGDVCEASGECSTPTTTTSGTSAATSGASATATGSTHGTSGTTAATGTASASSTTGGTHTSTASASSGAASSTGRASSTSGAASSTSGSTGGVAICSTTCNSDTDCSTGYFCAEDPQSQTDNFCAPDCSSGQKCGAGDTCNTTLTDADNTTAISVCYPNSGTCETSGGTTGTTGTTGGSSGGVSNIGASCTVATEVTACSSQFCKSDLGTDVCTCNCGGGRYQCLSDADCCLGPGNGQSGPGYSNETCSSGTNFSSGCSGGFCQ